MNLLYLNSGRPDYGQDILFAGLRKRAGVRLYELPFNRYFYLPLKQYPRNLGYHPGGLFGSLLQRIPWNNIDACVIATCNPNVLHAWATVLPKLKSQTRLVFVDGGDWPGIGADFRRMNAWKEYEGLLRRRQPDLVFKREMLLGAAYPSGTIPFPFGFNLQRVPDRLPSVKKYDVSFWAVESDPVRTAALALLQHKYDCRANGTVLNQTFSRYRRKGRHYLQELAACKIVLNFRGAGWDTLRYWETPAVGAFLLSQKPQIVIPDNFREGSEIVFCKDDLTDLTDLCDYYLRHDAEREKIAAAGEAWIRKYHSEDARAGYFLRHLAQTRQ